MRVFAHGRLDALARLQGECSALLAAFNAGRPELVEQLAPFLDGAAPCLAAQQLADAEAQVREWRARLVMAGRGIDPATLVRQSTQRRDLQLRVAFAALCGASELLRGLTGADRQLLDGARERLIPILLAGLHGGLAAEVGLDPEAPTQAALEAFWRRALRHPDLATAARQVAMQVSAADTLLLLSDLIAGLAAEAPSPTG